MSSFRLRGWYNLLKSTANGTGGHHTTLHLMYNTTTGRQTDRPTTYLYIEETHGTEGRFIRKQYQYSKQRGVTFENFARPGHLNFPRSFCDRGPPLELNGIVELIVLLLLLLLLLWGVEGLFIDFIELIRWLAIVGLAPVIDLLKLTLAASLVQQECDITNNFISTVWQQNIE